MGLLDLKIKNTFIPVYDIFTLSCGFYIGYLEGKGVDTSNNLESLLKYGPTIFAVGSTLVLNKAYNSSRSWIYNNVVKGLDSGNLEIKIKDNFKKRYKEFTQEEKKEMLPKILDNLKKINLDNNSNYLKNSAIIGTRTAVETYIGYSLGKLYSGLI
jgi:hypothetical protein